jgi:hypothetical protein
VRLDHAPKVHSFLRLTAAGQDKSMSALARKIISEHLDVKDEGGGK